jgi:rSAM/selenodomain-associated transferase 1
MNVPDTALLVFAKAPIPGQAKTRLIPALGQTGAAELHARMVHHTLKNAVASRVGPVMLWCASDDKHPFFAECARNFNVSLHVQHGNDLGQRMGHAMETSLRNFRHVLLIGTDSPALDPDILRDVAQRLRTNVSVVFVPAEDGGYALIGIRDRVPNIFDNIAWGGDSVMAHTRSQLHSQQLEWHELPPMFDIDTPHDLQQLQRNHPDLLLGITSLESTS